MYTSVRYPVKAIKIYIFIKNNITLKGRDKSLS